MKGRYGKYGGAYVPEILVEPIRQFEEQWEMAKNSPAFIEEFHHILCTYAGRPTPLTEVNQFSRSINGPKIYLKREDLLHTGAHKLNNTIGQCLLAKKMGKTRILAETGAGQHGVATATACAYFGIECIVYMGKKDMARQEPNVKKMKLLGARVVSVDKGAGTLKDAINEAMRDWSSTYDTSHYCLGSAVGPHPYPEMVAFFQRVIGEEVKEELPHPNLLVACVGGGSNAIGLFGPFFDEKEVAMVGVEAGGKSMQPGEHAASIQGGKPGVLHGTYTYLLQDEAGQIIPTSSISAGLDYPAIGPQHAALFESKRVEYTSASDVEALALLSKTEGIIPALESAHALAHVMKIGSTLPKNHTVVINLSGRGEKDLPEIFQKHLLEGIWEE